MIRLLKHDELLPALAATLAYIFFTFLVTHPVSLQLSSAIAGGPPFDALQYTWSFWWVKEALFTLHTSPSNLAWLHHPVGAQLPFLLAIPYIYVVGVPLLSFLSPPTVYNIELLSSFALSGLTMYLLCVKLTGDRRAAFVGGLVYAFFPSRIAHAAAGHLPHVTTYWFPLYALLLIRTVQIPTFRRGLLCGLCLGVSLLVHVMHIPYLLIPLTAFYLLYEFAIVRRRWPDRRATGALLLALLVGAILALPWFLPLIIATLRGHTAYMQSGGDVVFSTDLLSFVSPSPYNPVLQYLGLIPSSAQRVIPHSLLLTERFGYLGIIPLLLGMWGGWRRRRVAGGWTILACGAALFSLGPLLRVGGQLATLTSEPLQTYVPMPYTLIAKLPYMEWGRTPGRLNATVLFAGAVLASYGLADLLRRIPRRWGWGVVAILVPLTVAEFVPLWPFPTIPTDAPVYLQTMGKDNPAPQSGVLNLPMTRRRANHQALFYQTIHRRPILGGYVHRDLPGIPGLLPFLEDVTLLPPSDDVIPHPAPATILGLLQAYDVGYVFLFEDFVGDSIAKRKFLSAALGPPVAVEHDVSIFALPSEAGEIDNIAYGLDRETWHALETWDNKPARWMPERADLYIYTPREQEGKLRFTALPFSTTHRLQIEVNGVPLTPLVIGDWMTFTTSLFTLQPGLNQITFHATESCAPFVGDPRCMGFARAAGSRCNPGLSWERCLSILFQDIQFLPTADGPAEHPFDIVLGERVRFLGYNFQGMPEPGHSLSLTLYWQALETIEQDWTIFVHLLKPDGHLLAQHDALPLNGAFSTSRWRVGDLFLHRATLSIPADAPPGRYNLLVGAYTYPDLERLSVASDRPHAQDGLIWLQSIEIQP